MASRFSRFETVLRLQGFQFPAAEAELRAIQARQGDDFTAWQARQRLAIVAHHQKQNPFYRELIGDQPRTLDSWDALPIMEKAHYQRGLDEVLARPFAAKDVYTANTSGSSGHPFTYAKDRPCHALAWALIKHRYALHGLTLDSKQARFYGIPLDRIGYAKEKLKDRLMNRVRFPVFDLSDAAMAGFVETFARTRFEYIYGYTLSVVLFARYCLREMVNVHELCPSLKLCMVTSEVCTPEDRALMEEAFGIPVVNEYGASEMSIMAFEDAAGNWILSEEIAYLETTGSGDLLATSLHNYAFPIIRYRIGDVAQLTSDRIDGKYRCLVRLDGRVNDTILLPSGRRAAGLTFYYISRSILERSGALREFIIRQTAPDTFVLDVVADRDLTAEELATIQAETTRYLEPGLNVTIQRVPQLNRPESGKIKHFYSELG
jgi:phenylacetate-CoA ligase